MSLTYTQILETIDDNCSTDEYTYPVASKTRDINLALDKITEIIFKSSGRWQYDDSNHTDYPIITTALVQNQRDYTFTEDQQGNIILDIYKVMIADENGRYYELEPVDMQSDEGMESFYNGQNLTGKPTRYDKTGNGILLDCIPDYDYANGLKVFINRESSYFTVNDTTKKPGFSGLFHEYLALRPSYQYAYRKGLSNLVTLRDELMIMEKDIQKHYKNRARDEQSVITSETINSI